MEELDKPAAEFDESDLIPISAVQHYSYCPRQAALIHLEQVWEENLYTLRGRFVHEEVDQPGEEVDGNLRIERSLPLWSRRWGLVGKADVVEFHGLTPYPVDYKHGPRRPRTHDDLQVCAQAVCLEEMTGQLVPRGAIYHATSRRRREVECDEALRRRLREVVAALREALRRDILPPAPNDKRCRQCSLKSSCLPTVVADARRMARLGSDLYRVEEDG
ncbi:MAG: CRISPR-associated protein Cas4 [Proteobacteria bacterium]|nr:CRISPR-associated protein Cas4 [Pseudomonadota bacterium]MBU4354409.1 CRISPR-associated protein Cas4 [Pseudomonadota bacterium]MBU4448951.1 CRISPR-associated protein Cas4 [Pseudomonadota bacterium]